MWKRFAKVGVIVFCLLFLFGVAKKQGTSEDITVETLPAIVKENYEDNDSEEMAEEEPYFELTYNPTVRVVISDASFQNIFHGDVLLTSSKPYDLLSSTGVLYAEYDGGETIAFSSFGMKSGESLIVESKEQERFSIDSLSRSQGVPFYRGKIQVYKEDEGYVIVNELPLEDYLLTVVPSEMPSTYPADALSAQAVCARSYAYSFLYKPGYPQYDAHMDDSTSYQVYNNIEETPETTAAVRNTEGAVLLKDGLPVSTYFFSTSCGVTSNENVWSLKNNETDVTFSPIHVSVADGDDVEAMSLENQKSLFSAQNLCEEEVFANFIKSSDMNSLEAKEQWYRWEYRGKVPANNLYDRLSEIYVEKQEAVLTEENGNFVTKEPNVFKTIKNISVVKRLPGGVVDELLIETDNGSYLVKSEYYIRKVLADESGTIIRNDQSKVSSMALLPSAYFIIEPKKDSKGNVKSVLLTGGGYGHGVGMSQNGAKRAALNGMKWQEILTFFYSNLEVAVAEK